MLKRIMLSAIALALLAAPAASQEQKADFFGQFVQHNARVYDQLAAKGKLELGLAHRVYDVDGNACLGEVGYNTVAECPTYSSKVRVRVHGVVLYDKPPISASTKQ